MGGQRFDTIGVPPLIDELQFDALIADKTDASFNATIYLTSAVINSG